MCIWVREYTRGGIETIVPVCLDATKNENIDFLLVCLLVFGKVECNLHFGAVEKGLPIHSRAVSFEMAKRKVLQAFGRSRGETSHAWQDRKC